MNPTEHNRKQARRFIAVISSTSCWPTARRNDSTWSACRPTPRSSTSTGASGTSAAEPAQPHALIPIPHATAQVVPRVIHRLLPQAHDREPLRARAVLTPQNVPKQPDLRLSQDGDIPVPATTWDHKAGPSVADCLACVRQHPRQGQSVVNSMAEPEFVQFSREAFECALASLSLAASLAKVESSTERFLWLR
jgi:hypothetical protein